MEEEEDLTAFLPDELLLKIFVFVGAIDLPSVRCVCARWRRLGGDEMLWARARISQQTAKSDFEISRALRVAPTLGALLLDDPYWAPAPEVFAAALLTPRLEALQVCRSVERVCVLNEGVWMVWSANLKTFHFTRL